MIAASYIALVVAVVLLFVSLNLLNKVRIRSRMLHQQDALLASMIEGVVAVDVQQKLISVNDAAFKLLKIDKRDVIGDNIEDVISLEPLLKLFDDIQRTGKSIVRELAIDKDRQVYLRAAGTLIQNSDELRLGSVVVLNDVTQMRKLENVRKEFVSNVSHELRTPITSIKGFVETLLDGAMESPDDTRKFLNIIKRHADRLNAIIEELLQLARIEQGVEKKGIEKEKEKVSDIFEEIKDSFSSRDAVHVANLEMSCEESLEIVANRSLLVQALSNLIDNAFKYSAPETRVVVEAKVDNGKVMFSVSDNGPGIAPEHHERLFERFYRIDKGRSREVGGTGLGLSIVKHVAIAHGGKVDVQSAIGKGSTFRIAIPSA